MELQDTLPASFPRPSPNEEAPALVAALMQSQIDNEAEKCALACILHDDLGGLLVGAIMDMGVIANQPGLPDAVRQKFTRTQGLIRAAIDLNRALIESLRPTLLDHVGLYSALCWHIKASCQAAVVPYTASFPKCEQMINTDIKIGVFRIFQEALINALGPNAPTDLSLTVEVIADTLHCHLTHRSGAQDIGEGTLLPSETSMYHRAARMGGTLQWSKSLAGLRHMHLAVPLSRLEGDGAI